MHRSYPSNSIWTLKAPRWTSNDVATRRPGFTLIELLIVIAILGILVALLSWGVNAARISILKSAQSAEMANIASAIEAYRNKYGDYPPDGSSWPIVEAHLRKAFPNILITELNLLNPANNVNNDYIRNDNDVPNGSYTPVFPQGLPRVFDPAEALVFFLGGFSSDPQRPLTGPGGPFKPHPTIAGRLIYNTQRENAFFDFKTVRLTLSADGATSSDEVLFAQLRPNGNPPQNDLLPVYIGAGPTIQQGGVPIVYFDSRTYLIATPTGVYFNFHTPGTVAEPTNVNFARPYLSADKDTTTANLGQLFANNRTYQIMNAGYDKFYGSRAVPRISNPLQNLVLFIAPTGQPCLPAVDSVDGKLRFFTVADDLNQPWAAATKYQLKEFADSRLSPVDDNTSNFIDGPTFAESP
jgi:prepilin-type N-terminal cleavage/methylation domain-containing protein